MKRRFFVVIDLERLPKDFDKVDLGDWLHEFFYGDECFSDLVVYDSIEDIQADIKGGHLKDIH